MTVMWLSLALALVPWQTAVDGLDSDHDGLSDFAEVHRDLTDPHEADSDGDGTPDGDWLERREYTYVVHAVIDVMKPVTPEYLDDDFQDVRVLDESEDRVELEVLLYPFSTAPEELHGDPDWRRHVKDRALAPWLAPGPTSDWNPALREEITKAMAADGIDVRALDDRTLVEKASAWLLRRAEYRDGSTAFVTAFDEDGEPFVPEELRAHVNGGVPPTPEDWAREISARGMFEHRTRGSCSPSAIYLSGCLRALGIPTRTVLCIPLFDASDARERELVQAGLHQPFVRASVLAAMRGLEDSWSSHTFNEVFVGGRWWRLDYQDLGVGILRRDRFGLIVHVATFRDWADANMPATIGRRVALRQRDAVFDGTNPYSLMSVQDEIGPHSRLELPAAPQLTGKVESLSWTDDPALPQDVLENVRRTGRFGLIAKVTGVAGADELRDLLAAADLRVWLEAEGHPSLGIGFDPGCWWFEQDHALVYLPFGDADRRDLVRGVSYHVHVRNESAEGRFDMTPEAETVVRDE